MLAVAWAAGVWVVGLTSAALAVWGHIASLRRGDRGLGGPLTLVLASLMVAAFLWMGADLFTAFAGGLAPQAQFGVTIQAITSFSLRTRRNLYFTLVHSVLLLYVAGDLTYSPVLMLFYLGFGLTVLAFLAVATAVDAGARVRRPDGWSVLRLWPAGVLAVGALAPLAAASFLALPRFASTQLLTTALASIPAPALPRGQTVTPLFPFLSLVAGDGAPQMDLSYRGRPSQETVMYVRSTLRSYWRAMVFDHYVNSRWEDTAPATPLVRRTRSGAYQLGLPFNTSDGQEFVQTFTVVKPQPNAVFAGYWPQLVQFPSADLTVTDARRGATLLTSEPLRAGTTYTVLSRRPDYRLVELEGDQAAHRESRYRQLPPLSPAVADLARRVTAGATNDYDRLARLEHHLRTQYPYDLNIPPLRNGRDAVEQFLFDDRRGFCEQFATAFVIMARTLGYPARVATGYLPGEYDALSGGYVVRAADAHSWAEVSFAEHGWVPFDPTPLAENNPRLTGAGGPWWTGSWQGPDWSGLGVALEPLAGLLTAGIGQFGLSASAALSGALTAVLAFIGVVALLVLWRRGALTFTFGGGKAEVASYERTLRSYRDLERWMERRAGVPRRAAWETPRQHLLRAAVVAPGASGDLVAMSAMVESVAYGAAADPSLPASLRATADRLRSAVLKQLRERQRR